VKNANDDDGDNSGCWSVVFLEVICDMWYILFMSREEEEEGVVA